MKHPSSLTWFRLASSDLSLGSYLQLRVHLLRCAACRDRLEREQAALAEAERLLPPSPAPAPAPRRWPWTVGAAVALALLLVVVTEQPGRERDDLRAKGSSRFDLLVSGERALGSTCRAGEVLQGMVESERAYVLVLGIDPRGEARVLYPPGGTRSAPLAPGPLLLPQSWTLDEAEGVERFVALFSARPLMASAPGGPGVERVERSCRKVSADGGTL